MDYTPPFDKCNIEIMRAFESPESLNLNPGKYLYESIDYSNLTELTRSASGIIIAGINHREFAVKPIWGQFAKNTGEEFTMACLKIKPLQRY